MKKRCISFLAALAMVLTTIVIPGVSVNAAGFDPENVALGKTVTVSSVEQAMPQNVGANTVDGDEGTRWSSERMKPNGATADTEQTAQWLTIDLQAPQTQVESITINFYLHVWASDYQIQTAATNDDNTQWRTLHSISREGNMNNSGRVDRLDSAEVPELATLDRYVRFYFEKVNYTAGGTGVSITDIDIQGTQLVTGNIALNKSVSTSTVETAMPQNVGSNTVDGNNDTRWSSERMKENNITDDSDQTPQWLVIDLGAEQSVADSIQIDFYLKVWATQYRIETAATADAAEWTTVASVARSSTQGTDDQTDVFDTFGADGTSTVNLQRYVRFYFEKINVNAGGTGVSVREITINGTQPYIPPVETPQTAAEVMASITELPAPTVDSVQIELPEVPEGFEIAVVGSDREGVVSNDGAVTDCNIGDIEVTLLVEVRAVSGTEEENADSKRKNFTVTIPSKNGLYPDLYPTVANPNGKPSVIPTLQEWYGYEGVYTLSGDTRIIINDTASVGLQAVAQNMQGDLAEFAGVTPEIVSGTEEDVTAADIYIESQGSDGYDVGDEGYFMTVDDRGIRIYGSTYSGCLYGTITVEQILWQDEGNDNVPCGVIRDYPDYEIRAVMFDVGRIPHRLQYLEDYTKILTWYKMNEFQLHLNDDFQYSPEGLTSGTVWNGMHRLESDAFPSLTDNRVYTGERFDYFNNVYADPVYTKDDYRKLEDMANAGGIELIPEIDTPSHSNAYISYAKDNPDQIEWLGELQTGNNDQMFALNINDSNPEEREKAENARKFMEELYGGYLRGDDPVFRGDTVNIGADEYWDTNNREVFREYVNFLDGLMQQYGKTTRMWGSLKKFDGTTPISPENIVIDVWALADEDPIARLEEGFRVVNFPQPYLYTTPGRDHKDMIVEEWLFKNWDPTMFNANTRAEVGEPLLLGAKASIWGDEFREGVVEADLHERALRSVAMVAEKTWGGSEKTDDYIGYQQTFDRLQEGPGTQIAMTIDSETDVVADYDMSRTEVSDGVITVKDSSGNGYDAQVTGGEVIETDTGAMIAFNGDTVMTTPLQTLSYPYTISFDVQAGEGNTKDSLLFSGYDGQLLAKGINDNNMSLNRMFYHQSFDYELPVGERVNITIVGTARNTKLYVDGELVKMLYRTDSGETDQYFSTFVFPMETIGENFHGYIGNIKAYNKALQPEMLRTDVAEVTEVNVALNRNAYAERYGSQPDITTQNSGALKYHPAYKATDGDKTDAEASISPSTDPHSFWRSSNNSNNDYLMVDLGEQRDVIKVVVNWQGENWATGFDVQVSMDRTSWDTVEQVRNNSASISEVTLDTPVTARYVKIQGVSRNTTHYAVSELEVFEKVDRTELNGLIAGAEKIIAENDPGSDSSAEAAALEQALISAKNTYGNAAAVQREITDAAAALDAALTDYENSMQESTHTVIVDGTEYKVKDGETLVIETPEKPGHRFDGFYLVGTDTQADFTQPVTGDMEVESRFTQYKVTLSAEGGVEVTVSEMNDRGQVTIIAPVREGYNFLGWRTADGSIIYTGYEYTLIPSADTALTAVYEAAAPGAIYHTVTINGQTVMVQDGQLLARPADPVNAGYRFIGWYIGDVAYDFSQPVTSDLVIEARFERVDTSTAGGGANVESAVKSGDMTGFGRIAGSLAVAFMAAGSTAVVVMFKRRKRQEKQ